MRKLHAWAATAVLGAVVAVLAFAAPAFSDKPAAKDNAKDKPTTLNGRIAADSKVSEGDVAKVLAALGPAVRDRLAAGEKVELPGLGAFRVVHIPEHRDLVDGRPALVPGSNYVDFTPFGGLIDAANAPGAVPQETVPPFEFNPLPGQTPSQHVPFERMPNIRTR
jgi:nucleoid DNA-binding protein